MSTPDTKNIGIKLQAAGENLNTWGDPNLNNDFIVVSNIGSKWNALSINGDTTISETNYSTSNDTEVATIDLAAGTVAAAFSLTFPSRQKRILLRNSTGYLATCKLSATTGFTLPTGRTVMFATDGASDAYNLTPNYGGVSVGANSSDILNMGAVQALITAASTGISGGFASNFFYTATGGETSKSGADDYGATLAYTPGTQTEVFLNGVVLVPAVDYVASTGTSITGLSALSAGDILYIRAWATFAVGNAYTQAQTNALFAAPPIGVGSTTPTTGAFTTLTASGTISGAGFTARFASPGAIGGTAASTGAFTTLSASGGLTVSASGAAITGNTTLQTVQISGLATLQSGVAVTGASTITGALSGVTTLTAQTVTGTTSLVGPNSTTISASASIGIFNNGTDLSLRGNSGGNTYFQSAGGADTYGRFQQSDKRLYLNNTLNGSWPTSSAGLSAGTLWSNSNIITTA